MRAYSNTTVNYVDAQINFNIQFGANVLKIAVGECSRMISTLDLSSKGADDVITSRCGEGV